MINLPLRGCQDNISRALFSSDGRRVITASDDKKAKIFDVETGDFLHTLDHNITYHRNRFVGAVFSPDSTKVLSALSSDENLAQIWNAQTGVLLYTLRGHTHAVRSVDFSPDGRRVVTGSTDRTAKLWNAETGELLQTFKHGETVNFVVFSPDSRKVLTISSDGMGVKTTVWLLLEN